MVAAVAVATGMEAHSPSGRARSFEELSRADFARLQDDLIQQKSKEHEDKQKIASLMKKLEMARVKAEEHGAERDQLRQEVQRLKQQVMEMDANPANDVSRRNRQLEAQNTAMKEASQLIMEERDKLKLELKKVMKMYIELANVSTRDAETQYEEDDEIDFGDDEEEAEKRKALVADGNLEGLVEVTVRQDSVIAKIRAEMEESSQEATSLRRRNAEVILLRMPQRAYPSLKSLLLPDLGCEVSM